VFTSAETAAIAAAPEGIPAETLRGRYDRERFLREDLYPFGNRTDEEDASILEYLVEHYASLRAFVMKAREKGMGLMVYLC
jgi:hypothetical protein